MLKVCIQLLKEKVHTPKVEKLVMRPKHQQQEHALTRRDKELPQVVLRLMQKVIRL